MITFCRNRAWYSWDIYPAFAMDLHVAADWAPLSGETELLCNDEQMLNVSSTFTWLGQVTVCTSQPVLLFEFVVRKGDRGSLKINGVLAQQVSRPTMWLRLASLPTQSTWVSLQVDSVLLKFQAMAELSLVSVKMCRSDCLSLWMEHWEGSEAGHLEFPNAPRSYQLVCTNVL
jgi:hypothetical protein